MSVDTEVHEYRSKYMMAIAQRDQWEGRAKLGFEQIQELKRVNAQVLDEIERLKGLESENKALKIALKHLSPCLSCERIRGLDGALCDYCDDTYDAWKFDMWQWRGKDET